MRPELASGKAFARGRRLAKRPGDVQQTGVSFPGLWWGPAKAKSRWIPAASAHVPDRARDRRSEPLSAPAVRPAIAVEAVAVVAAVAAAVVAIPVKSAAPPALAAAEAVLHVGQHGKPALLAVIERLVERVGGVRDLLHGGRRNCHVVGTLAQPRDRIVRLLLVRVALRRIHPRIGAVDPQFCKLPHRGLDRRP